MQGDGGGISSQASQPKLVADPKSHTPVSTPAYPRRGLQATYKWAGRPHLLLEYASLAPYLRLISIFWVHN